MFVEMSKQSDVIIENLSPGTMRRLGLGYQDIIKVNPSIIYCSIAGYGQSGPYKDLPAHDHQIQAMSGIMDMNGTVDGPPTRIGVFVGDLVTPLYAAYSILGALRHKEKTGKGQYLDASMIDTLATLMFMEPMEFVIKEGLPLRSGNDSRSDVTGLYRLTVGEIIITVGNGERWKNLCRAIGVADVFEDPKFATVKDREAHIDELREKVQHRLGKFNCIGAIELLQNAGIPVAKVRSLSEAITDPHFHERGTLRPMRRQDSKEPIERGVIPGFSIRFSGGDLPMLEGGAKLGHHNEEIYTELLGLDAVSLLDLKNRNVI